MNESPHSWKPFDRVIAAASRWGLAARGFVEEIVDLASGLFIDARHLRQIAERGALDRFQGAEMVQQRAFARWADAGDFLQAGLADVLLAAGAVRSDGEAVRLVAQPLDEIKQRIARRQFHDWLVHQIER